MTMELSSTKIDENTRILNHLRNAERIRTGISLIRDEKTGLAWIEDLPAVRCYFPHPKVYASAGVKALARRGDYAPGDRLVRCGSWLVNTSRRAGSGELAGIARQECRCGGKHSLAESDYPPANYPCIDNQFHLFP